VTLGSQALAATAVLDEALVELLAGQGDLGVLPLGQAEHGVEVHGTAAGADPAGGRTSSGW